MTFQSGKVYFTTSSSGAKLEKMVKVFWIRHKKNLVRSSRKKLGRKSKPSLIIIDSQSVKNSFTAREKGYDSGKQVSGIKRHIFVDIEGLPHGTLVTKANVPDRNGAILLAMEHKLKLEHVIKALVDSAYQGPQFDKGLKIILHKYKKKDIEIDVVKRCDLHKFVVLPKRWIVERTFAWLSKYRRLNVNRERYLTTSQQIMNFAFIHLMLKRL